MWATMKSVTFVVRIVLLFFPSWYQIDGFVWPTTRRYSNGVRARRDSGFIPTTDTVRRRRSALPSIQLIEKSYSLTLYSSVSNTDEAKNNTNENTNTSSTSDNSISLLRRFTLLTPLWTVLAAVMGLQWSDVVGPALGSVTVVSRSLFILMLAMALSTTSDEFSQALQKSPAILALNAICCFGLMPMIAILVAKLLHCDPPLTIGTILLGCVCGGQASNLFALLAGGDVSLSVVCTVSTTLLGVVATPLLVKLLLGGSTVVVNGMAVLRSVVSLVLGPLAVGMGMGRLTPRTVAKLARTVCPLTGIGATLLLVAGGAANVAAASLWSWRAVGASILLPLGGGAAAWLLTRHLEDTTQRTVVVEVLSKSPTLAYVLALKHFNAAAATVPAAAMVSLAVVGAMVASLWSLVPRQTDGI